MMREEGRTKRNQVIKRSKTYPLQKSTLTGKLIHYCDTALIYSQPRSSQCLTSLSFLLTEGLVRDTCQSQQCACFEAFRASFFLFIQINTLVNPQRVRLSHLGPVFVITQMNSRSLCDPNLNSNCMLLYLSKQCCVELITARQRQLTSESRQVQGPSVTFCQLIS